MNNIILLAIKDSFISKFKSIDSNDFWIKVEEQKPFSEDVIVSKKFITDETYNIFLNDEGFKYLETNKNDDFFDLFKEGETAEFCASKMLGKNYSDFDKRIGSESIHLFALYEKDIEEYKNDKDFFTTMSKFISKNKRENKTTNGDSISARIFKETQSPLTYLAYIPKDKALAINVSRELITFFGNKNIELI